jgi:DNA-binding NarL/FixJ family response regulator
MRIVIADDAVLVRRGIATLLTHEGVEIVGEAANATELHEAVLRTMPDIAIIDIRMPPTHSDEGVRAAERIRRECPNVGILLLSQYVNVDLAVRLLEGREVRTGYLLKDRVATVSELISALGRIHEGGTVVEPTLVASLVDRRREKPTGTSFTERERDVLALIAEGRTDRAIAEKLCLSRKTIETHSRSIFRKLGLIDTPDFNKRVHAVLWFLRESSSVKE